MSERRLHLDVESRSACDLMDANAYVYFDDPTTALWCASYAFSDAREPKLWHPGDPCPPEIEDHILGGLRIWAWNANFERLAWRTLLGPKHGWPVPELKQYRCSMAQAYALAMPGKLEHAAPALGLDIVKDALGSRLMKKMSRPRKPKKGEPEGLYWHDKPEDIARLGEYCQQDVRTEMACHERLLALRPTEQEVWFLDQEIADRGVFIDDKLCRAAEKIVIQSERKLDKELAEVTDWTVTAVSNTGQLRTWLKYQGFPVESVAKDAVIELLIRDDLPTHVRRALEIRQEGGKTSTAKIDSMLARRQRDGRMRGNLQYHGASTGRWAARGAQLQNLPRPALKKKEVADVIEMTLAGETRMIEALYGHPMQCVADCIRGMIKAGPGNVLRAADFSQIEARVDPWLAGQTRTLDAFRLADAGKGPDIYKVAASGVYDVPVSAIDDLKRQVGKVSILALGFGGGPSAFAKMAKNYGLDLGEIEKVVFDAATPENVEKCDKGWKQRGRATGMSEEHWKTAELIKLAWRDSNQEIVAFWRDLEDCAIAAVSEPGTVHAVGKTRLIKYKCVGSWLFCQLPSGRAISYAYPRIVEKKAPWGAMLPAVVYKGVHSITRKWCEHDFYGGLACENVTQAAARDVMAEAMLRVDRAGYPVTITIHDEVVCEPPKGFGSQEEFLDLMTIVPAWANGLPIAASGFEAERYRK